MKSIFSCFLLLIISINLTAQQDCYIQVKAEPNISVFLNDEFKGKTNVEFSGLIIEKLKAGSFTIKVVKDGYIPQTETIVLKAGEVKIYQVKPFIPQYKITQSGNEQQQTIELKTGNLKIQSLPVEIQIEIIDLNIKSNKDQDEWNIEDIPIGIHKVKFTWGNKILIDTVRVVQGTLKHIFVNLISGEIENRSENIFGRDNNKIIITFENGKEQYFHVKNGSLVTLQYVFNEGSPESQKFNMPNYYDFILIGGPTVSFSTETSFNVNKIIQKSYVTYVVYIKPQKLGTYVLPEASIEYKSTKYKSFKTILVVE
jgi:hypothetical protein